MNILNGVVSLLCLLGPVMGQGRFYRSQLERGSIGSRDSLRGRSRAADFFNRNLQLDTVARRGSSRGGSRATLPFGSRQRQRGGSAIQEDPAFIRRILGSTIRGRELRMGELDLPTHGGAGIGEAHADGRNNGWDGNPQTLTTQYQHSWSDPFQGRPIPQLPIGFNGDFNSVRPLFGSVGIPPFRARTQFLSY